MLMIFLCAIAAPSNAGFCERALVRRWTGDAVYLILVNHGEIVAQIHIYRFLDLSPHFRRHPLVKNSQALP